MIESNEANLESIEVNLDFSMAFQSLLEPKNKSLNSRFDALISGQSLNKLFLKENGFHPLQAR